LETEEDEQERERRIPTSPQGEFRWTERRTARFVMMLVSGAVVVGDIFLLYVFLRTASTLPGGWKAYWYIPAGIAAVFLFAMARFRRQLRLFRLDE
jgi:hypothetical protein